MAIVAVTGFTQDGDTVTVLGTVDNVPVSCQVWASHLTTLATAILKRTYVANQLKASVPVILVVNTSLNGSLTV